MTIWVDFELFDDQEVDSVLLDILVMFKWELKRLSLRMRIGLSPRG